MPTDITTSIDQNHHQMSSDSAFGQPSISELLALAGDGLVPMFDADRQLFCHKMVRTKQGLVREGLSPRYTVMTLLGLRKLERAGGRSAFDTAAIYKAFVRDRSWIRSIGDFGLVIWLTAAFDPQQLAQFSPENLRMDLDRYPDAKHASTTELSWFLAGLAHAAEVSPTLAGKFRDVALETYRRLKVNQGASGLFGHMNKVQSPAGFLRGGIGSFADQIYPIYAFSKFAKIFDLDEPLASAIRCATTLCATQGPRGQWWWLYGAETGKVLCRYPVYSVHQQAMAPMGLFALKEASLQDFDPYVEKGLRWICGYNELNSDMRNTSLQVIWRCIHHKRRSAKYLELAQGVLGFSPSKPERDLEVLYEDRPYELGWLLFAFAERGSMQPDDSRR